MKGKDKFLLLKPFLRSLEWCFRYLSKALTRYIWILSDFLPDQVGVGVRYSCLRCLAKKCGDCINISRNVEVKHFKNLEIGDHVSVRRFCYIDAAGNLTISNHVSIAHSSSIISLNHAWANKDIPIRQNPEVLMPVNIKDDVWIGCGVRVLGGTTIGPRSIVAAGAVVTKDVERNTIAAGVPARFLRHI